MKRALRSLSAVIALLCTVVQADVISDIRKTDSYRKALAEGAVAQIKLSVLDDNGVPVENASTKAVFDMTTYTKTQVGITDTNGVCILTERTRGNSIRLYVEKDGYYKSERNLCLIGPEHAHAVNGGVWQPSPLLVPLVLRKIHAPIKLQSYGGVYHLPATNQWCAFDFVENDWVDPIGKGKMRDVEFKLTWYGEEPLKWLSRDIEIRFPGNPFNGGCLVPMQTESEFPYSYEANPGQYFVRDFHDESKRGMRKFGMLDGSRDFVFRFRSITNETGQLISCNYGRFRKLNYGHERSGQGSLVMRYDYNALKNDNNLENKNK